MQSGDDALVVHPKVNFAAWTGEFYVLHFLSELLIRRLLKSFLGIDTAVGRARYCTTKVITLPAG
jgi:hypothetical protein